MTTQRERAQGPTIKEQILTSYQSLRLRWGISSGKMTPAERRATLDQLFPREHIRAYAVRFSNLLGLSTLIALRKDEKTKSVPVVLVTGIQDTITHDFSAFLERFKRHHPDAYLEKPVDPEKLLKTLDEVCSPAAR